TGPRRSRGSCRGRAASSSPLSPPWTVRSVGLNRPIGRSQDRSRPRDPPGPLARSAGEEIGYGDPTDPAPPPEAVMATSLLVCAAVYAAIGSGLLARWLYAARTRRREIFGRSPGRTGDR